MVCHSLNGLSLGAVVRDKAIPVDAARRSTDAPPVPVEAELRDGNLVAGQEAFEHGVVHARARADGHVHPHADVRHGFALHGDSSAEWWGVWLGRPGGQTLAQTRATATSASTMPAPASNLDKRFMSTSVESHKAKVVPDT